MALAFLVTLNSAGAQIESGQYVGLREISEINGNPWATMAELNVLYQ